MWIWNGGFRAYERNMDGSVTEKVFTSSAQARQFVEKSENVVLAKRVRTPIDTKRQRKKFSNPNNFTPSVEQRKLIDNAKKIAKGL